MLNGHLDETQIQEYLDGNIEVLGVEGKAHLEGCTVCRKVLGDYMSLYEGLRLDPGIDMADGFAAEVADKAFLLPQKKSSWQQVGVAALLTVVILFPFVFLFIFTDVSPLAQVAERLIRMPSQLIANWKQPVQAISHWLDGKVSILFTAVLVLAMTAVADHFLKKRFHGRHRQA